jgi:biopolymer transport protein ExbB/TolQ
MHDTTTGTADPDRSVPVGRPPGRRPTEFHDPFESLSRFRGRVHRAWAWTITLFAVVVVSLWISGIDYDASGHAIWVSPGVLTRLAGHVFSASAWPISAMQYLLIALALFGAMGLGRYLIRQYEQIDRRLLDWAARGFGELPIARDESGPVGRIQAQIAAALEGGTPPGRDVLLEEFDADFERRYAPLRHMASVAIFLGLLGTFWGLQTHAGGLSGAGDMAQVKEIAAAMHTAFACSIVGVLSALILGFLSLRMHGAATLLRQRLDHVLTVRMLPEVGTEDLMSPLVGVLEHLREAILRLGNVGAAVQQLPDLLTEMRGLFGSSTAEHALTTAALQGLEAAVANLDTLNDGFDGATERLREAAGELQPTLARLDGFAEGWNSNLRGVKDAVADLGTRLDATAASVNGMANEMREAIGLVRGASEAAVRELAAQQERALAALQNSHREAVERLVVEARTDLLEIVERERAPLEAFQQALEKRDTETREALGHLLSDGRAAMQLAVQQAVQLAVERSLATIEGHERTAAARATEQVRLLQDIRDALRQMPGRRPERQHRPQPPPLPPRPTRPAEAPAPAGPWEPRPAPAEPPAEPAADPDGNGDPGFMGAVRRLLRFGR